MADDAQRQLRFRRVALLLSALLAAGLLARSPLLADESALLAAGLRARLRFGLRPRLRRRLRRGPDEGGWPNRARRAPPPFFGRRRLASTASSHPRGADGASTAGCSVSSHPRGADGLI
eukprot:3247973-Pyramimonas_sp.AAC.2